MLGMTGTSWLPTALAIVVTAAVAGLVAAWSPRLVRRLRRRAAPVADDTLARILDATTRMSAIRRLPELQQSIVDAVSGVFGLPRVALYMWSDATASFEPRAFAGYDEASREALRGRHFGRDEILALRTASAGEAGKLVADGPQGAPAVSAFVCATGSSIYGLLESVSGEARAYLTAEIGDLPAGDLPRLIGDLQRLLLLAAASLDSLEVCERLACNNAELSLASEKLASLADMKANFVANVSHELRTPLTSISAYTELLQQNLGTLPAESLDEFLKIIHGESVKLTGVINDILDLSQMENGRPSRHRTETDLVTLVRRLEEGWRSRAAEKRLTLEVKAPDKAIRMPLDPVLIQQLITHLLANATKFTAAGGRIVVTLDEMGTAVRLTVEDTGIGIPEDKLGAIFDKFYQVDGSATREHNGQGVGLAICHDIVTHHDGRIWAENVEPRGARFQVLLPRRPAVVQPNLDLPAPGLPFEPGEFLQRLLHWVAAGLGVQTVALMEPDASGESLSIRAAIGLPDSVVQGVRIRPGQGYAGHVWSHGETLLITDLTTDERFRQAVSEPRYSTPSLLLVPLMDELGPRGVISVNNRVDGRPLDEDDRLFLENLAPRILALLGRHTRWQEGTRALHLLRDTLRATTTVGHLQQESLQEVCQEICLATARRTDMPEDELGDLAFALRFYDVGMGCIPPQLLDKPEPLSRDEQQLVRQHVAAGLEVLEPLDLSMPIRRLILHHHENHDGSGYPDGLAGEAIPRGSRLLRLADSLTALLTPRPWRKAWSLEAALEELQGQTGARYCPALTSVFLEEAARRAERIAVLQERGSEDRALKRPALDRKGMMVTA
jgi:signal transduction histidine kinase